MKFYMCKLMDNECVYFYCETGDSGQVAIELNRMLDCFIHSREFDENRWKYVLNDRSEVKCQLLDKEREPEEVSKHTSELVSYFERVPTQKEEVKSSLLFQIKVFTTVLKVEYKRGDRNRENMMCDVLFHVADKLQGLLLFPDMSFYSGKRELVFNDEGKSDLVTYGPMINTDFFVKKFFMTDDSENKERRVRTMKRLKDEKVAFENLEPMEVDYTRYGIRIEESVIGRIMAIASTGSHAFCALNFGEEGVETWWKQIHDMEEDGFEPLKNCVQEEKDYLFSKNNEENDHLRFFWQFEECNVFMWSLGLIKNMSFPSEHCEVVKMLEVMDLFYATSSKIDWETDFPNRKGRREIMDEADVTLHYLLACVEAMDKNKKMPRNIDTDIAMHRNHAFNWLLGIQPEWDVI